MHPTKSARRRRGPKDAVERRRSSPQAKWLREESRRACRRPGDFDAVCYTETNSGLEHLVRKRRRECRASAAKGPQQCATGDILAVTLRLWGTIQKVSCNWIHEADAPIYRGQRAGARLECEPRPTPCKIKVRYNRSERGPGLTGGPAPYAVARILADRASMWFACSRTTRRSAALGVGVRVHGAPCSGAARRAGGAAGATGYESDRASRRFGARRMCRPDRDATASHARGVSDSAAPAS